MTRFARRSIVVGILLGFLIFLAWRSGDRPAVDEIALAQAALGIELESHRIDTGEITLHVVMAGPKDGPPVLLLHGFPEFWYSWRNQIAALARAGFRAMAPDLRGYNRSDKPSDSEQYRQSVYAGDALALLDQQGYETTFLAGHDVGGGVAWRLVLLHPERVRKAVIFNAAHPFAGSQARPEDHEETISWFRTFFRMPWLPELVSRSGDWWLLARNLRRTSNPGSFDDAEMDVYKAAWSRDNAISTMIHSYRASRSMIPEAKGQPTIPVRVVWGANDAFFNPAAVAFTRDRVGSGAFVEVPDASHWVLLDEPELTSREMIAFFGPPTTP